MIRVKLGPGSLRAAGHAGYAAPGRDIVCAAASMLLCTLAQALGGKQGTRVLLAPGKAEFVCRPDEPALAFAADGLRLLAERYPENVDVDEE